MNHSELFEQIKKHVFLMLKDLSPDLTYHSVFHTIDVLSEAERIFTAEKVNDPDELLTLRLSALFHDTGFLLCYDKHEEAGCNTAKKELPSFGISSERIDEICSLIMATKIPQSPQSFLAEILCDADLDYLGRDDFFPIALRLFDEWKNFKRISSVEEWNRIQCKFLEQHHYFTATSQKERAAKKEKHLKIIRSALG